MHFRLARSVGVAIVTMVALAVPAFAQTVPPAAKPSVDLYLSPTPGGGVIPSGDINVTPNISAGGGTPASGGSSNIIPNTFNAKPVPVAPADVTNMQGCGGVGQGEFTTALYNMPESFTKFQQDVDSLLSKQILTMNYIMPQTAALFDQLNSYGNQRYEVFQKGCNLDSLKQDARKQYLDACVAKQIPIRKAILITGGSPSGSASSGAGDNIFSKMTDEQVNIHAYAQAWEVCSNQYVSDTTILKLRTDSNKAFAEKVRAAEDVNATIKPLLCPTPPANTAGSTAATTGEGCWAAFLIPQVRLCHDASLKEGCTDSAGYGVKEPIVSMPHLFDIFRFIMDDEITARRVLPMQQQVKALGVGASMQTQAAADAALIMSTGTAARLTDSTLTVSRVNKPDLSIEDFQLNYLSCKNPSILLPLEKYAGKLQDRLTAAGAKAPGAGPNPGGAATITLTAMDRAAFDKFVTDKVQLAKYTPTPSEDDVKAFGAMLEVGLGCTANQNIPILDPNTTVFLNTQCQPEDKSAFYTMAGYDVSLAATRSIYRYVNLRLKQTYTRLMTEQIVPVSTTTAGTVTPTLSPELNARLATAVKETMIPYIDSQIERIDELNATRGQYAQRAQQIYTRRTGCMTGGPAGAPPAPRR